ncbi:MAG: radical SAM protein [Candidatus Sumerlaeaceae bacterium]|jgi:hypothetical protein
MRAAFLYCDVGAPSRASHLLEIGTMHQMLADANHDVRSTLFGWFESCEQVSQRLETTPNVAIFYLDEFNFSATADFAQRFRQKYPNVQTIAVGPYTVLAPETILHHPGFDYIVAGEPESALFELVGVWDREEKFSQIRNLWLRRADGEIARNPLRPLIDNPDVLPLPDRSLIENDWLRFPDDAPLALRASLGCPHECTFCFVPLMARAYAGKGDFYRPRAAGHVAGELLGALRRRSYSRIVFTDEMFPVTKTWLRAFLQHVRGLELPPWEATVAVERLDREALELLYQGGCRILNIGVETGNEQFRKRIATRNLLNECIVNTCDLAAEIGIKICARVMLGLPLENESHEQETLTFFKALKASTIEWRAYFPVEKTPLGEYCRPKLQALQQPSRPLSALACGFSCGNVSKEQFQSFLNEITLVAIAKAVSSLPAAPTHALQSFFHYLPNTQLAFRSSGTIALQAYTAKNGTRSVLTLVPTVAIVFPSVAFPDNSVLQMALSLPEKSERYLSARNASARLEIACLCNDQRVVLAEKHFGPNHGRIAGRWRELLIPIPEEISAGQLVLLFEANAPEPEEVHLWIADPILVQEASLVRAREAEQLLQQQLQSELEKLNSRIQALEVELAQCREQERIAKEECAKKAKRVSELQLRVLDLEKQCEYLEAQLQNAQKPQGLVSKLSRLFPHKKS